jgi:C-terminal processing protease CtpA/Prc
MVTPDGETPEGRGVQPDVEVELAQDELLQGIDAQLEAAIAVVAAESAR